MPGCLVLVIGVVVPSPSIAESSGISNSIRYVASDLIDGYGKSRPVKAGEPLAVLYLPKPGTSCSPGIGRRAVRLLADELDQRGIFKSRVVSTSEAAFLASEVGRSSTVGWTTSGSGSRERLEENLVVAVGVEPVAGYYDIDARLVDLVSGEVLAIGHESVAGKELTSGAGVREPFEAKGKGISAFALWSHGSTSAVNHAPVTMEGSTSGGSYALTTTAELAEGPEDWAFGLGIRFAPIEWLVFDLAWSPVQAEVIRTHYNQPGKVNLCPPQKWEISRTSWMATAYLRMSLLGRLRCYAGLGGISRTFSDRNDFKSFGQEPIHGGTEAFRAYGLTMSGNSLTSSASMTSFLFRGGAEFMLLARVGLSVFATVLASPGRYSVYYAVTRPVAAVNPGPEVIVYEKLMDFSLPRVLCDASITYSF